MAGRLRNHQGRDHARGSDGGALATTHTVRGRRRKADALDVGDGRGERAVRQVHRCAGGAGVQAGLGGTVGVTIAELHDADRRRAKREGIVGIITKGRSAVTDFDGLIESAWQMYSVR